jgi:hypothetical protein
MHFLLERVYLDSDSPECGVILKDILYFQGKSLV